VDVMSGTPILPPRSREIASSANGSGALNAHGS
jgi:hypothetical protein